jgi:nicotinamidase/pyrazinamidase
MQDALLIVDMQADFCEGGALAAYDTESMIEAVNSLVATYSEQSRLVIFTRDWHPENHCSFSDFGGQWPAHCVRQTRGADFHPGLLIPHSHLLVSKAANPEREAYSGFDSTGLDRLLKNLGISSLEVCGIATEYCVRSSVEDAVKLGYEVKVNSVAIRPVAPGSVEEKEAMKKFKALGVKVI